MVLLNRYSAIQSAFRRFCTVYKLEKLDPLQPSGRCDIPSRRPYVKSNTVWKTRTFHPNLHLYREASNYSGLSSTSGQHFVFDKLWDFFPKHRYGKITAIVRTRSCIRQVSYSKSRRPDASLHGLEARASDMEIACIWSTVRKTNPLVRMHEALIWKLRAAKVRSSWRQGNTIWT
jgi:hypothetical protein